MAAVFESIIGKQILDNKTKEAMSGFSSLSKIKSGEEIACVFEFDDGKHPIAAYLDENYFEFNQDNFAGREVYVLCKVVIRKVSKGEKIRLDEIFEDVKKMPLNRSQLRNMPKNIDNPAKFRDEIKAPVLVVLLIAVYY